MLARAALALSALLCLAPGALAATPPIGEGAWSWFGDPRAVTHAGVTYVGWVDHEGDIKVSSYDHASGERVTAMLAARLNRDDHANPSIQVRPDGRLVVYYSRHVGPAMHYRVSSEPGSVRSWEAPQTLPVNVPGKFGYTYPNPIRMAAEGQTYLFWRGGNYNPTFSTQADGSDTWSPARNLIVEPNERPYTKYAESGGDTIHVAYTNAHPNEAPSVNLYYARIRGGRIERANGQQVGTLAAPIAPADGDLIFDRTEPAWVHDVAAEPGTGNPVIVFASFANPDDHRYHYARWTGSEWVVHEITAAGDSFRGEQRPQDYYSGGLTLDHEDPSRVYLSRQVGPGAWQVEAWTTTNGGASWTSQPLSAPSTEKNVRPVSPRGMDVFGGDLSAIWMRGAYPNYEEYATDIAVLSSASNAQPVADAEPAIRSGSAPLLVRFDGSFSEDPDGSVQTWQWAFGDGASASGEDVEHTYTASGRYFPALTVTDNQGAKSTFVEEIAVGVPAAPTASTGGSDGTVVHGAVDPENQPTSWYFEYGPTSQYGAVTQAGTLPAPEALHQVQAQLPGLVTGRLYHYRLVASNAAGTVEGEDRLLVAGSGPATADAYRDAVLATPQLASYWRLGELAGSTGANELTGAPAGSLAGRFLLGRPGALGPLANTAAGFDGLSGELSAPGPALTGGAGTLEGWFRWRAGTAVMRDNTGPSRGWLLAFGRAETLRYRVGGQGYDTGVAIEDVRDGEWHHLAATKNGGAAALYVDGVQVHSAGGADSDPAALPWHVMRNGTNLAFTEGEADEIAIYTRALGADEVAAHHALGRRLAAVAPPPDAAPLAAEPPAAGSGAGGGVLGPTATPLPRGSARVRGGVLVVRGAPGTANRLLARRRGPVWRVSDAAAALRAGSGCRQLRPRVVSCRAALVRRIVMYGGAGNDRLTVIGRIPSRLVGGPGRDRYTKKRPSR